VPRIIVIGYWFMKKLFGITILSFLITISAHSNIKQKYSIGEKINNKVTLDNKISVKLSDGEWVIVERTGWRWGNYTGQYIFLVKNIKKEIAETISLGFLNTGGKRMADINSYLYEVVFLNKHDGCYGRPEYYKLELFHKGAAINCMIISHIDVNKEIYNPDDKKTHSECQKMFEEQVAWAKEADGDFVVAETINWTGEMKIALKAIRKQTGARGLRSILENILLKTMYDLPSQENIEEVIVDASAAKGLTQPILVHSKSESKSKAGKTSAA
jgi:hypothetical protein